MMDVLKWISDNMLVNFTAITTVILFFAYFRLNKRQKKAEVRQAEAGVKQSEGGALTTMQSAYDAFTEDLKERYDEVSQEVKDLKESNKMLKYEVGEIKRSNTGLTRELGILKTSLSETEKILTDVERIACIKFACKEREPKLGEYKHKREA